ncbi:MAG TPA: MFS transporter [Ktedonobacterales bacterium]
MNTSSSRAHEQPESAPASGQGATTLLQRQPANGVLRAFSSLRHRNFRLYWFGELISLMGTWMQRIGQAWLALQLTHSALQLGLVGALQLTPVLLFSIFGGVFADRWPKRRVLLWTQTAAMAQALALWALISAGVIQMWHLYLLALLLGLTSSLQGPTLQAFVVEMVGREDLPNAIALRSSAMTLARIVGPSLGGVIIADSREPALFLLNGLSYLAVIVSLAIMDRSQLRTEDAQARAGARAGARQTTWQSLREGIDYVRSSRAISLLLVVVGLALLFGSNFNVILPLFATDVLHTGAPGLGALYTASGVGSLIATLWLAWDKRRPTIRQVVAGALVFSVLEACFAVSRLPLLSLALIAIVGFAEMGFATAAISVIQSVAPHHLRGRVMSVYVLFFDGTVPLGYMLTGWLASLLGAPRALLICALLSLLVAVMGWLRRGPAEHELARQPEPDTPAAATA